MRPVRPVALEQYLILPRVVITQNRYPLSYRLLRSIAVKVVRRTTSTSALDMRPKMRGKMFAEPLVQ